MVGRFDFPTSEEVGHPVCGTGFQPVSRVARGFDSPTSEEVGHPVCGTGFQPVSRVPRGFDSPTSEEVGHPRGKTPTASYREGGSALNIRGPAR
jgi:hypothetical protein